MPEPEAPDTYVIAAVCRPCEWHDPLPWAIHSDMLVGLVIYCSTCAGPVELEVVPMDEHERATFFTAPAVS